jgi:TolB-like protein
MGFPVALLLSWAYELTPEGIKPTKQVPLTDSITQATGQRLNYVITGLLTLGLGFVVVDQYVLNDAAVEAPAEPAPALVPDVTNRAPAEEPAERDVLPNSVAVLPLQNLSPDPDNAYFAAGMHEEILNQLAKLKNLNVISRTSVLRYAEDRPPIPQIATELKVTSVMEGSVRYANDRVLVTVQLIDPETDSHLWSESYPGDLSDVFAIQADIAMNVANALAAEFSVEEQQRIERQATASTSAYDRVLRVNNLVGVGNQAPRMHELLDQAIELDPDFARAYGLKAALQAQELINTTEGSARRWAELEPLVREYADRALALDPEQPAALNALVNLGSYSWRWSEAQQAFERRLAVDNSAGGTLIWFQSWSGNEARALELAEREAELDPLNPAPHWIYGIVLNYAGNHDAATTEFRASIELAPNLSLFRSWLAMSEIARGNVDTARRELELGEQFLGSNRALISLFDIAYGYGRIGDADDAQRLFEEISAAAEGGQDIGAGGWALAHLAVGDVDEALEWLERGAEKASRQEPDPGYYSLMNLRMNFTNDPLLERPEFVDVRNRLTGN